MHMKKHICLIHKRMVYHKNRIDILLYYIQLLKKHIYLIHIKLVKFLDIRKFICIMIYHLHKLDLDI